MRPYRRLNLIEDHLKGSWIQTYQQVPDLAKHHNLKNKVVVISGGSRGIGLAIGKRCAQDNAKIVILGKTSEAHKHLEGTIYSAAKECEQNGASETLAIQCDIRYEDQISKTIQAVISKFGRIDVLVNNASAIKLQGVETLDMKKFDLMHQINARGTYLMTKYCVPHLKQSEIGHVLNLSPPLIMHSKWFANQCAYGIAKYSMSMQVLGFSEEFKGQVAFNALWPRTIIATAAIEFELGGKEALKYGRTPEIVSEAAYKIFCCDKSITGLFFIDDEVLSEQDLSKYKVNKSVSDKELIPDYFELE